MTQQDNRNDSLQGQPQANEQRSENLLPGDDAADGRYEVAEEVNLDQQSDALRRVGKPPKDISSAEFNASMGGDKAEDEDSE